jgi:hypothetical protein
VIEWNFKMSYDVAIVATDIVSADADAWLRLDAQIEQQGDAPPQFQRLHDQIVPRYPCLSMLSDEAAKDCVWSSGPLWSEFGSAAAVLAIRYPRADEVVPFVVETARSLGLSVFDWTSRQVHRPDGIDGLDLSVEDHFLHLKPTLQQVLDAVRSLTPDSRPGFLRLDRAGSGYAQVAGGNGAYAVEWRQVRGNHVPALHGRPAEAGHHYGPPDFDERRLCDSESQ